MPKEKNRLTEWFPLSVRDLAVTVAILAAAAGICAALRMLDEKGSYVSMIFILAVFLVSRFTNGYFFGLLASLLSVLAVNYVFTYPYFAFNFTLAGYPLTILCMLAVAVATSALTTQTKRQEEIRIAGEREKTRSNLLRAVSHDLRTPLTSILGATSAVMENDAALTPAERMELLGGVREDAQWLIRVVENLLTITRIDGSDCARITKEPEAAEEVLAEAVSKFSKRFPGAAVQVHVPDELLMVPMDAMLIEQVLINLMENAVLHGEAAVIGVTAAVNKETAVFSVWDNGKGIDEAMLPHIFEGRIHQDDEEADHRRGMGIGLSVCHTIIKVHGGAMTAANRPEGGAILRFYLPIKEETV
ncbi:MAG: DUF4118 domain-containing protein [Eubacteriales bacterium]|nr:DUF4118 domain-containing protein [Eubacteriales bacterium]